MQIINITTKLTSIAFTDYSYQSPVPICYKGELWGNVTGERLWYALHGYAIKAQPSKRGMYGHGRVLPPEMRTIKNAYYCFRILLVKAARRMRRDGYYPGELHLWMGYRVGYKDNRSWAGKASMYYAAIQALDTLWRQTKGHITLTLMT